MSTPAQIQAAINDVRDERSFIQRLLIDALQWPIDATAGKVDGTAYEWSVDELNINDLSKKIIENRIWQIQTPTGTPWGVFLLEFKHPDAFASDRGMTGPLRAILRGLVPKARASANNPNQPTWKREHLLFICTHQYKHFRFAYFKAPEGQTKTAPLAFFGWSPDVPARTACEHNLPHLQWPATPTPAGPTAAWAEAFNVEKVTKRFYEDYKAVFNEMETTIDKNNNIKGEELRLATQSLFNRLMFLRFIERKGWLKLGTSKDYLRELFQAGPIGKKSFYLSRLRPLFFDGLAKEHSQPSLAFGDVPFLNGGLFEETELDTKIKDIPDAAFTDILDPVRGLFYRFNFTVEESTPLDIEVAVDPEMLGKVFEELVTGRHESGSYYTPRPVVSFMCREALKGYLADKLSSTTNQPITNSSNQQIDPISQLVDHHIPAAFDMHQASAIVTALDALKAVDPACGSGAYLLGLLHELVALYQCLYSDKLKKDARTLYDLKLRIISHNLYGVDIDPFATNIAMLRLWLSLAVDSDDPIALPNLDFKIETGDSLLGPDPQTMPDLFRAGIQARADLLVVLKDKYLTAHGEEKSQSRSAVEKEEKEIAFGLHALRSAGVFDWRIEFAEVFVNKGGFDIVVANPPYLSARHFMALKKEFSERYATARGSYDIYILFIERGLQLLGRTGFQTVITSNKFLVADYGTALRKYLRSNSRIHFICDLADCASVFNALVSPAITMMSRGSTGPRDTVKVAALHGEEFRDLAISQFQDQSVEVLQKNAGAPLNIYVTSSLNSLIGRIERRSKPLSALGTLRTGIMGFDYWALEPHIRDMPGSGNRRYARMVTNSQIEPFRFVWGEPIRLYKAKYENPRIDIDCGIINDATRAFFRKSKVIMRGVARHTTAAWDDQGHALLVAVHGFVPHDVNPFFILGLLNSELFDWLHRIRFYSARIPKGSLRYPISFWESLPCRTDDQEKVSEIAELSRKLAECRGPATADLRNALDTAVLSLYEVSADELTTI